MLRRDDVRIDLRLRRSDALFAAIVDEIGDLIPDEADREEAFARIRRRLHAMGAEVVTDQTRAEVGLSPRDEKGWTIEEFQALEKARIDALYAPRPMLVLSTDTEKLKL